MLNNVQNFLSGFMLPLKGAKLLLSTKRTKRWAVMPLIVNFIIYILIISTFVWLISLIKIPDISWDFWGSTGLWLSELINGMAGILKWTLTIPLVLALCYFTFTLVGMVIAAPFNDILSEKLEDHLCIGFQAGDEEPDRPLRLDMKAAVISIVSSLKFAMKQVFYSLMALPFLLIPFVGATLLFLVTAYFTGIGFLDVGMARNYLPHECKLPAINQNRWKIIGFGAGMDVLFMIPFAGLMMLPLGVAGGTSLYCDIDWEKLLSNVHYDLPQGFVPPKKRV